MNWINVSTILSVYLNNDHKQVVRIIIYYCINIITANTNKQTQLNLSFCSLDTYLVRNAESKIIFLERSTHINKHIISIVDITYYAIIILIGDKVNNLTKEILCEK